MAEIFKLSDDKLWDRIFEKYKLNPGVYTLLAMNKNGRIHINRFLDVDRLGRLYIGEGIYMIKRVMDLKKSIAPDYRSNNHTCGRKYKSNSKIAQMFPYENLYIEVFECETPFSKEKEMLKAYFDEFGEVPPLNSLR